MLLLLAVMTTVKAGAQNTLVSHIDVCKSGPGAVCIVGWVYDSEIKNWTLGSGIDVYAIASNCPPEGYPGYDSNRYDQYRDGDIEYVERPDVNAAFDLSGKHGFRIKIDISPVAFEEKSEMPLYVRVIATVNNANGFEDVLLNYTPRRDGKKE